MVVVMKGTGKAKELRKFDLDFDLGRGEEAVCAAPALGKAEDSPFGPANSKGLREKDFIVGWRSSVDIPEIRIIKKKN